LPRQAASRWSKQKRFAASEQHALPRSLARRGDQRLYILALVPLVLTTMELPVLHNNVFEAHEPRSSDRSFAPLRRH
jgi:hypothetical protein